MLPLTWCPQSVQLKRADTTWQPQPYGTCKELSQVFTFVSAAHYYCLLWSCSAMKINSPWPCPITFGTIYLPVFFTLCYGFIYSINFGCHTVEWSYLPQRENALGFAGHLFALCCIHRIKVNSGAARKKKTPLRLGAQRYNGLKTKALLTPGK